MRRVAVTIAVGVDTDGRREVLGMDIGNGLMTAIAALRREESRGAHYRTDFPHRDTVARRRTLRLDEALAAARELGPASIPLARRA